MNIYYVIKQCEESNEIQNAKSLSLKEARAMAIQLAFENDLKRPGHDRDHQKIYIVKIEENVVEISKFTTKEFIQTSNIGFLRS